MNDRLSRGRLQFDVHECRHRKMLAVATGSEYVAFPSLREAHRHAGAVVILEAGSSEQIYLTCPVDQIACSESDLERILLSLDACGWSGRDQASARVFFELHPRHAFIAGGMGGGRVTDGVWMHPQFKRLGLFSNLSRQLMTSPAPPR